MKDEFDSAIPAAGLGHAVNSLAEHDPVVARELSRLEDLMNRGEETTRDFLRLCHLMFDLGAVADAEYLLRRNVDQYQSRDVYRRLFGDAKPKEFEAAVSLFQAQFGLELELIEATDFLVSVFSSAGGSNRSGRFSMLSEPCEVTIAYLERDRIDADAVVSDPDREYFVAGESLAMSLVDGVWGNSNRRPSP